MDKKKLEALAKRNAAKSVQIPAHQRFGKKYDRTLNDEPTDAESLKNRDETERFFSEMKKREF